MGTRSGDAYRPNLWSTIGAVTLAVLKDVAIEVAVVLEVAALDVVLDILDMTVEVDVVLMIMDVDVDVNMALATDLDVELAVPGRGPWVSSFLVFVFSYL